MPGLAGVDDRGFIEAMQQINEAIQNPVFFLSFLGALAQTAAAAEITRTDVADRRTFCAGWWRRSRCPSSACW